MCIVEYERGTEGLKIWEKSEWKAEKNKQCDPLNPALFANWADYRNEVCNSVGDCGISENYQGEEGFYEESDVLWYSGRLDKDKLQEVIDQYAEQ